MNKRFSVRKVRPESNRRNLGWRRHLLAVMVVSGVGLGNVAAIHRLPHHHPGRTTVASAPSASRKTHQAHTRQPAAVKVHHRPAPARTYHPPTAPGYVVLIVLDGARPDYFRVSGIPHVRRLIGAGSMYTAAWAGILESETPSGHATIATGSVPNRDGILSFGWVNGDNIPVNLFDPQKIRSGAMERVMQRAPAPTIAELVHRGSRRAKVVALSGFKYYAADAIGGPDADVIMYGATRPKGSFGPTAVPRHVPPSGILNAPGLALPSVHYPLGAANRMAMRLAGVTFKRMRQQVTLINLPEFDWPLGHVDGGDRDPKTVRALMRSFDADLAALEDTYRKAGVLDRTLFVLTADHGFAPVEYRVSADALRKAVAAAGTSIVSETYHTASYLWLKDERKAAAAAANIAKLQNPYIQSVYFRMMQPGGPVYIRASGPDLFHARGVEAANQYLLSTFNGPNGPDVAVFMTEHAMAVGPGQESWKGDHGGAAWESQNVPLILSGPGIRRGFVSSSPAPLMDIAPTLLSLLGIAPKGMQGVPLADAMQRSSARQRSVQRAQQRTLLPVVSALRAESRLELQAHR